MLDILCVIIYVDIHISYEQHVSHHLCITVLPPMEFYVGIIQSFFVLATKLMLML